MHKERRDSLLQCNQAVLSKGRLFVYKVHYNKRYIGRKILKINFGRKPEVEKVVEKEDPQVIGIVELGIPNLGIPNLTAREIKYLRSPLSPSFFQRYGQN
ncbi:MAG: hypothetical protein ABIE22_03220 [archaeon]